MKSSNLDAMKILVPDMWDRTGSHYVGRDIVCAGRCFGACCVATPPRVPFFVAIDVLLSSNHENNLKLHQQSPASLSGLTGDCLVASTRIEMKEIRLERATISWQTAASQTAVDMRTSAEPAIFPDDNFGVLRDDFRASFALLGPPGGVIGGPAESLPSVALGQPAVYFKVGVVPEVRCILASRIF